MPWYKYRPIKQWGRYNTKMFRRIDHYWKRRSLPPFAVPPALKGVTLYDPNDPDFPRKSTPDLIDIDHPAVRGPLLTEHADYKAEPCLLYDGSEPLTEGVEQAQLLCRCVLRRRLPAAMRSAAASVPLGGDHERLLRESVMRAYRWDATVERLPRRHDAELFWFAHRRVHGIPQERKNRLLLQDLYYRSMAVLTADEDSAHCEAVRHHRLFKDHAYSACLPCRAGGHAADRHMVIRHTAPLSIVYHRPLAPVADAQEVNSHNDTPLPDIAPVGATIDFRAEHIYSTDGLYPMWQTLVEPLSGLGSPRLYAHTALTSFDASATYLQKYPWAATQLEANAIMKAYAGCVAMAQRLRPSDEDDLRQRPIVTQVVQLKDGRLDCVVFQLNTLRADGRDEGVKNIAWHDSVRLFSPPPFWEPMDEVADFNPDAFRMFLALVMSGADAGARPR